MRCECQELLLDERRGVKRYRNHLWCRTEHVGVQAVDDAAPSTLDGKATAIINAIDMQLESGRPVVATVAHLTDALRELTLARGVDVSRIRLTEHVDQLMYHLRSTTATQ